MRSALAATFLVVLLAMSCAYCTSARDAPPLIVSHLGGPGYRVFDADRIDSYESQPALMRAHNEAQNCSQSFRPFNDSEAYVVSKIEVRTQTGWTDEIAGLNVGNRIYIVRSQDPNIVAAVLKHEYVHYVTEGKHPDIDDIMIGCGVHFDRGTTE
jgi:hypothetical protein